MANPQEITKSKRLVTAKNLLAATALAATTFAFFKYSGYPPPQRYIVPSQRSEFAKYKAECENDLTWVEMGAPGYNLGDSFLPTVLIRVRAKALCAEALHDIAQREAKSNQGADKL